MEPEHIGNPKIFQMDLTDDIDPPLSEEIPALPPSINCNKKAISSFLDLLIKTLDSKNSSSIKFTLIRTLYHYFS